MNYSEAYVDGYENYNVNGSLDKDINSIWQEFDQRYLNSKKNKKIIADYTKGWFQAQHDNLNGISSPDFYGEEE